MLHILKGECSLEPTLQLSFKYFMNSCFIRELLSKELYIQTPIWIGSNLKGEMFIGTQPQTFLQKFYEFMLYSEVIVKRALDADDNCNSRLVSLLVVKLIHIFEGGMLIGTKPTILLQIFYEFMLYFEVIVKIALDTDDNCNSRLVGLLVILRHLCEHAAAEPVRPFGQSSY